MTDFAKLKSRVKELKRNYKTTKKHQDFRLWAVGENRLAELRTLEKLGSELRGMKWQKAFWEKRHGSET